jgi:hypothetical protein
MDITLAFSLWIVCALVAFWLLTPRQAALSVFLGGWLLLPVGDYAPVADGAAFPYWIIGAALPSDMLLTKAWVAPVCALLGAALFDRATLLHFRPSVWDVPMALWCVWPLLQALVVPVALPDPWLASAYLAGSWGASWLLGRLYFGGVQEQGQLLTGLAWAGLVCLPIALLEGLFGPFLYAWLYSAHPFASDGAVRYVGWRPMGFFEHGNQYGLWVAVSAVACLWVWHVQALAHLKQVWKGAAAAVCAMALASQSAGAIVLLGAAVAVLQMLKRVSLKWVVACTLGVAVLLASVYVSGRVPLTHWAKQTTAGQAVVGAFKSVGRGSFTWRIAQDQKALALVGKKIVVGSGQWNWWQSLGTRPWGLWLLLVGQYGLLGLVLALGAITAPALLVLARFPVGSPWTTQGAPAVLAVMVLMACLDARLNAFLFFPALLCAAALVSSAVPGVAESRRLSAGAAIPVGTAGQRL